MDLYSWLKAIHILAMFVTVTAFVGGGIFFRLVMRSGDTRAIARAGTALNTTVAAGGIAVGVALVFGFLTALNGGMDLLQPWLVIAYVIVIAITVIGTQEGKGYGAIAAAAAADGDGPPSAALLARIADGRLRAFTVASVVLYGLVVLDMVVKPFR